MIEKFNEMQTKPTIHVMQNNNNALGDSNITITELVQTLDGEQYTVEHQEERGAWGGDSGDAGPQHQCSEGGGGVRLFTIILC